MFSGNKSRNWLTIASYSLIITDMVVGCATITCMIVQPNVYDLENSSVPAYCHYLILFQKILYSIILLTQIFEWIMYIIYMRYQSKIKLEELAFRQKEYNRLEKWCLFLFFVVQMVFCSIQCIIDAVQGRFYNI